MTEKNMEVYKKERKSSRYVHGISFFNDEKMRNIYRQLQLDIVTFNFV